MVKLSGPAVVVMGALTSTRLCASKVRVTAASPSVLVIGELTLILPSPSPSSLVLTSTLEPPLSEVEIASASVSPIIISSGSNSQVPASPLVALTSTGTPKFNVTLPDVSTKPPSPVSLPPRALIRAKALVVSSDQTIILPPSPLVPASAVIVVAASTLVFKAFLTVPCP